MVVSGLAKAVAMIVLGAYALRLPASPERPLDLGFVIPEGAVGCVTLPGEGCTNAPLPCAPFPDRVSAFVWRNWFCVPKERLAKTIDATVDDVTSLATAMGLPADPEVPPRWREAGYITILRRNWHLLDYDQLVDLLGWTREKMRYHLLYDDYLFQKLGSLKPKCEPLRWDPVDRRSLREIAVALKEEGVDDFEESPRFSFIDELSAPPVERRLERPMAHPLRITSGYYADCLDPLWDDEIASFSEGILARYAAGGVNGVWLHVVLNTLAKDPFFVEFGEGAERRQRNLRKLVDRAAEYGIKVYLYMNDPRPMPPSFFEKNDAYRACRGTLDWTGRVCSFCLQAPEVRRWVRSAIGEVFRAAPGLGGVFTISATENLVHCLAHGDKAKFEAAALREPTCRPELFCPRCARMDFATSAAGLNNLIAESVHAVDPLAKVLVWDWGWTGKAENLANVAKIVPLLPTNSVSFMTASVRGKPIDVDGTVSTVNEHTLSQIGPGEVAKRKWAIARAVGLGLAVKAQASGSWEIATVPYIPVMNNVANHAYNLMREGVTDALLSWTCGAYPAPNLKVFNGVRATDKRPEDVLVRVSEELYGPVAAPVARRVWAILSDGFSCYPFQSRVLYHGPHHMGPANPLYPQATGYAATMTGIPYDDLDGWRRLFPRETYVNRFRRMADAFARGAKEWEEVIALADGEGRRLAQEELGIIRMIALNFASTVDQSFFVMARERGDVAQERAIAARELGRARELLPIVRRDSRLGFEGASHYFFIPQDLREKILNCRFILKGLGK